MTDRSFPASGRVKYSAWSLLRGALGRHRHRPASWRNATPKPIYDVIIGGGGGNTGRNTTIVRSNYLFPESARLYDFSLKL